MYGSTSCNSCEPTGRGSQASHRGTAPLPAIKALDKLYPGLGAHLEEETTVAIDGEIHEVGYLQPLHPGSEVFFIPKIEGG